MKTLITAFLIVLSAYTDCTHQKVITYIIPIEITMIKAHCRGTTPMLTSMKYATLNK